MKTPGEDRCPTVRMFPDYADTVLWFDDPVDYDLAGLTQGLVRDLRVWEQSYYESLTPDLDWKSAELARRFTLEGNRLARRVADELGDGYEIEFNSYEKNVPTRRFRGTGPALNARAAAAFDALAAALQAKQDEISRARTAAQRGENTGWFAYSPLSDTVFKPPRAGRE
ncbi:hypothetical protein ACQR35_00030 [Pseudarthrobacter sp. J1738]|uniref:hypothetical protein n=1 Tax=unclassified Pseudarthrobacter TaxID=2647000 RepID=UPI003D2E5180